VTVSWQCELRLNSLVPANRQPRAMDEEYRGRTCDEASRPACCSLAGASAWASACSCP
jgi:hypothetical protein